MSLSKEMGCNRCDLRFNSTEKMDGGWSHCKPPGYYINQCESALVANDATEHCGHNVQTYISQRLFFEKVDKLTVAMKNMGNPIQEATGYLLTLDTKDIAHPSAAELITTHCEKNS
jgi:hypothetical protein